LPDTELILRTDIHQHLWPPAFIEALRRRTEPPCLDDWTLKLHGEPDFAVNPDDHDVTKRISLAGEDNVDRMLISLSSPLGIEDLPGSESQPLLDAFHAGALSLPDSFGVWGSASMSEPNAHELLEVLNAGCVGLQIPATALLQISQADKLFPLFDILCQVNKPLFVHPGSAVGTADVSSPAWWPAVVSYVNQMHTAWFTYKAAIEETFPKLRVCFAMLAGLAPLHDERCINRDGPLANTSTNLFVETSSYGPTAISAVQTVIGEARIVNGSDRPYAKPPVENSSSNHFRSNNVESLINGPSNTRR
jgi:6-methylsalicylate decarboxylase